MKSPRCDVVKGTRVTINCINVLRDLELTFNYTLPTVLLMIYPGTEHVRLSRQCFRALDQFLKFKRKLYRLYIGEKISDIFSP